MAIARTLEPEVMDTEEEAHDYNAMDHRAVNAAFCHDLIAAMGNAKARVLDVGTGTALIPIQLCGITRNVTVLGLDLACWMLALAERNIEQAGLESRIELLCADAKHFANVLEGGFDVVMSNTIVHHIPDPKAALAEMLKVLKPGGLLFVRDLARPATRAEIDSLVAKHAAVPAASKGGARAMFERQRSLFEASLHASLTLTEAQSLVASFGIDSHCIAMTSDRHWTLTYRKPS